MTRENPLFTIKFDCSACAYEIRLNDVPVHVCAKGYPMEAEIPVNQWMKSGANRLSLHITLREVKDANAQKARSKASLCVRPMDNRGAENIVLSTISYTGGRADPVDGFETDPPEGEVSLREAFPLLNLKNVKVGEIEALKGKGAQRVSGERVVSFKAPFPKWRWLGSNEIPDAPATRDHLIKALQRFWSLLDERDFSKLDRVNKAKTSEYSAAYFMSPEQTEELLKLTAMMADHDLYLYPFEKDGLLLEVFGNGRLARLVDRDGDSPIVFVEKDESAGHYMDAIFCKTAGDGWIVIR